MNLLEGFEVGIAATKDNLESARVPDKPAWHKNVALKNGAQAEAVLDFLGEPEPVRLSLRQEDFPERRYPGVTLPA